MFLKDGMIITFNVDIMRVNKITYGENRKKKIIIIIEAAHWDECGFHFCPKGTIKARRGTNEQKKSH